MVQSIFLSTMLYSLAIAVKFMIFLNLLMFENCTYEDFREFSKIAIMSCEEQNAILNEALQCTEEILARILKLESTLSIKD